MFTSRSLRLSGLALVLGATVSKCQEDPTQFDWSTIDPSADLEWSDCYGGFYQCARLEVPYDYSNESDTRTMAIALQMLPAVVPVDDPTHAGSIFINPGGPGHPGTEMAINFGEHLQLTFDKPGEKHYDIIGWDPRGVGNTEPKVKCLDGIFDRDGFFLEQRGTHAYQMNPDNIAYLLATYKGLALKCEWQEKTNGLDLWPYVSTALVVEDMVRMIDKLDEERTAAKKRRGLEVRQSDEPARLLYYGVSYGTVIGNMFASIHPGRVGRLLLDGVVDAPDFFAERGWLAETLDTDKVYEEFMLGCWKAGPEVCPLIREGDSGPDDIEARVWDLMEELDRNPKGLITADGKRSIVHGQDISTLFGALAYSPVVGFSIIAAIVNAILEDVWEPMLGVQQVFRDIPNFADGCPDVDQTSVAAPPPDFLMAIVCSEADPVNDKDVDWWVDYALEQEEISKVYGHAIVHIKLSCSSYPYRSVLTYTGPFTSPAPDTDVVEGKPAAPLFFINNRLDPITPAKGARDMRAEHPGAGLMIQNSIGHGALIAAPSNCSDALVREYFDTGAVPDEEEAFCEQTCGPWDAGCKTMKTPGEGGNGTTTAGPVRRALPEQFARRRSPWTPRLLY